MENTAAATPEATTSLGSHLVVALVLPEKDILDLDYGEDDDVTSNLLISEEEEDIFVPLARATQPVASVASRDDGGAHQLFPPSAQAQTGQSSFCLSVPGRGGGGVHKGRGVRGNTSFRS